MDGGSRSGGGGGTRGVREELAQEALSSGRNWLMSAISLLGGHVLPAQSQELRPSRLVTSVTDFLLKSPTISSISVESLTLVESLRL